MRKYDILTNQCPILLSLATRVLDPICQAAHLSRYLCKHQQKDSGLRRCRGWPDCFNGHPRHLTVHVLLICLSHSHVPQGNCYPFSISSRSTPVIGQLLRNDNSIDPPSEIDSRQSLLRRVFSLHPRSLYAQLVRTSDLSSSRRWVNGCPDLALRRCHTCYCTDVWRKTG